MAFTKMYTVEPPCATTSHKRPLFYIQNTQFSQSEHLLLEPSRKRPHLVSDAIVTTFWKNGFTFRIFHGFLSLLSDHLIQWSDLNWVRDMYYASQSMRRNFRKNMDLQMF